MNNNIKIGERQYSFGLLPATKAVFVEVAIARVIGEPLFKALTEGGDDAQEVGAVVIGLMLKNLDHNELQKVMETIFDFVSVDGKQIISIDEVFTGKPRELWQVFIYALRFNFSDFFPESLLASIQKKIGGLGQSNPQT